MAEWLPFGFAVILWFSGSPAMGQIWVLSYGLGLIPTAEAPSAIIAVGILAVIRMLLAKANRGQL